MLKTQPNKELQQQWLLGVLERKGMFTSKHQAFTVEWWRSPKVQQRVLLGCFGMVVGLASFFALQQNFAFLVLPLALAGAVGQSYLNFDFLGRHVLTGILRPLLRLLFYLWPLWVLPIKLEPLHSGWGWGLWIAAFLGVIVYKWQELTYATNRDFQSLMGSTTMYVKLRSIPLFIGGAIGQELLYRFVLLAILNPTIGLHSIWISAMLFSLEHYLQRNGYKGFDQRDYISFGVLSITGALVNLMIGSPIPSVILHVAYNLPMVISIWFRPLENKNTA